MNANGTPAGGGASADPATPVAWTGLGAASLAALLILYRPYPGITHDAHIYIGQAMAALDPHGIGRDLMFVNDQQSRFSLFPAVTRAMVGVAGPAAAALALALAGLAAWLAGAAALASRLARGRLLWACLVCILVLAPEYGGLAVFGYGEPFATPRPFAEAAVMAALALLSAGRKAPAFALFAVAAAIHPIMALPGIAAGLVLLAVEDRRWLWVAAAGLAAMLAAAALGLPVAERLFTRIDPTWLSRLVDRNVYLFPSRWQASDLARLAVQLATLVVAAAYVEARARILVLAVIAAGLGGLLLAWLFGDLVPSLLVTQVQPWRALWLVAVLGNGALALAAVGLWRAGGAFRLALAALTLAWLCQDTPALDLAFSAAAPAVQWLARRERMRAPSRRILQAVAVAVGLIALGWAGRLAFYLADYLAIGLKAGAPVGWQHALGIDLPRQPVAAAAIAVAAWQGRKPRLPPVAAAGAVLALGALVAAGWDVRTPYRRRLDEADGRAALVRMIAPYPGEVLWLGGDTEAWFLAGRPNWAAEMQGAGMVFSRPLAKAWDDRMGALRAQGLAPRSWREPLPPGRTRATRAAVEALCARPDAPAVVVSPGAPPPGAPAMAWRPAAPRYFGYDQAGGYAWRRVAAFAVMPCPAVRAGMASPVSSPPPPAPPRP